MYLYSLKDEKANDFFGIFQAHGDDDAAANLNWVRQRYPEETISLYKVGYFSASSGSVEPLPEPVKIEIVEEKEDE